jgi:capsular exopolysaccharide family
MADTVKIDTYNDPKSPLSEIYRTLRTNIKFLSVDRELTTILFTSTGPNEGKSTVVSNLAVTLCKAGSKVLVLEGDLRNPTVHKMFGLHNGYGVTNVLMRGTMYAEFIQHTVIENLDIISSGPKPPNPSELLGSSRMKALLEQLKKDYDYVLIDAPPVVVVTDAALLASECDGAILVVSSGETIIDGAVRAKELLTNVNAKIIGVVLNKCKDIKSSNYYYYHYYDDGDNIKKRKK